MTDVVVLKDKCFPELVDWYDELREFRHDIHRHPELGFETARTCAKIVETLKAWGVPADKIDADTVDGAVFVLIEGNRLGKTVALRADMDAPPMNDCSENAWKSVVEGRCHACGHDGHTTWLMGAVRWFHMHRDFPGRLLAVFQPAEEIGRGALRICEAGILEKYNVTEIYGAHGEGTLDKGVVGFCYGPAQASCDFFYITIKGVGAHGARPHLGVDPVPIAAQLVGDLQTIVSRKVNPIEKAVLSVCSVNAGGFNTPNVIPHFATLSGTVRTFNQAVREQIETEMRRMAQGVAEANGAEAEVKYDRLVPSVINHADTTRYAHEWVKSHFGEEYAQDNFPISMGGEDFAEYQFKVPGSIVRFGLRDEAHTAQIHNQKFDSNDEVIPAAATYLAGIALERLEKLAGPERFDI